MGEKMREELLLKQLVEDVNSIKQRVIEIQIEVSEINDDLHEVRPEYIEKLKKIDREGKFRTFSDIKELRREIETA